MTLPVMVEMIMVASVNLPVTTARDEASTVMGGDRLLLVGLHDSGGDSVPVA